MTTAELIKLKEQELDELDRIACETETDGLRAKIGALVAEIEMLYAVSKQKGKLK